MLRAIPGIVARVPISLGIAVSATLIGWTIGFLVALIRIYRVPVLAQLSAFYVSFIRGTPLIVQMYLTYYGVPVLIACLNIMNGEPNKPVPSFSPVLFAIIAFSLNCGGYSSETMRAAILSIDKGQIEAAYSIGLNGLQTLRRVILPLAMQVAVPSISNSLMSNIQGTSLAFSIAVVDIMAAAKMIGAAAYRYFEVFVVVAFVYWGICIVMQQIMKQVEKRIRIEGSYIGSTD
jgi:His/Glu/Gln/Arg/opine family amino acid ABC transporter permease subunit